MLATLTGLVSYPVLRTPSAMILLGLIATLACALPSNAGESVKSLPFVHSVSRRVSCDAVNSRLSFCGVALLGTHTAHTARRDSVLLLYSGPSLGGNEVLVSHRRQVRYNSTSSIALVFRPE